MEFFTSKHSDYLIKSSLFRSKKSSVGVNYRHLHGDGHNAISNPSALLAAEESALPHRIWQFRVTRPLPLDMALPAFGRQWTGGCSQS